MLASPPLFEKVVIFGVGLIGGSFALALRQAGQVGELVGFGRTLGSLSQALELGIVDRAGFNIGQEVSNADLVLIATPVGRCAEIMARIAPCLGARTVVTDAGSTKADVVAAARQHFGDALCRFVPAHPIAGAENSGALAARVDLYQQKNVVLTPLPENSQENVARVRAAWENCGGLIKVLTPEEHDQVFAAVSHLPHLLSFALVHELLQRDNHELLFSFAASGFRDFTRIAASHPEMWRDIFFANRTALLAELSAYEAELAYYRELIESGDAADLEARIGSARAARTAWAERQG